MLKRRASSPVTLSPHSNANQTMFGKDTAEGAYQPSQGAMRGRGYRPSLPDPRKPVRSAGHAFLAQSSLSRARRHVRASLVGGLAAVLVSSTTADAAGMIRDAETEALIRTYAKPIFDAAGLGSQAIEIHIVNDRSFNAFVVDGHNMFIHAGTLMEAKTPNAGDRRHRPRKRPHHRRASRAAPHAARRARNRRR